MLTPTQAALCERDGRTAAHALLSRLAQHLHPDAYASAAERRIAAFRALEAFCDVFADALADAYNQGHRDHQRVVDVFDAVIRRHRQMLAALAASQD